jgi:hypothetical protein
MFQLLRLLLLHRLELRNPLRLGHIRSVL